MAIALWPNFEERTVKLLKEFDAQNTARWIVDGTPITVVTDADIPPGRWRQNMASDLKMQDRGLVTLPCVHWSISFQGKSGTHVHGRSWVLHLPREQKTLGLWQAVEYASTADWTEVQT